jgi:hypothetical protein
MNCIVKLKTVAFSDGVIEHQVIPGVWPSGSYRTSGTNSRMRVILRLLATGNADVCTMGDDAVEGLIAGWSSEEMIAAYAKYGFVLKPPALQSSRDFEFCSKLFRRDDDDHFTVTPTQGSIDKMLINFVLKDGYKDDQLISGLSTELRHSPLLKVVRKHCVGAGLGWGN